MVPSGADWRLADGTMVEAAGMLADPIYAGKIRQKRAMAEAQGIRLVVLTPERLLHLDQGLRGLAHHHIRLTFTRPHQPVVPGAFVRSYSGGCHANP